MGSVWLARRRLGYYIIAGLDIVPLGEGPRFGFLHYYANDHQLVLVYVLLLQV